MAAQNDGTLSTQAQIIRDETVPGANTALRVGTHMIDMINSKVNWTQVDTDVTLAADSDQRTVSQKAIKAYVAANSASLPYISYHAFITQTGTANPTVTVQSNELSGPVVWTRAGVGAYIGTLTGAFTANKTQVILNYVTSSFIQAYRLSDNQIEVDVQDNTGADADAKLIGNLVEIRIYS